MSQQVQSIQQGLATLVKNPNIEIELVGKNVKLNKNVGIFITTNPNYAGRSQLPPNLTKLFRPMAMTRPDRELIAQVMLFSQGFRTAESLASKIVPFFNLCDEQLSPQPHYDFGLRALKAVLQSAGILKRERLLASRNDGADAAGLSDAASEQVIVIQSVTETIVPKLVADDVPLLTRCGFSQLSHCCSGSLSYIACWRMCSLVSITFLSIWMPSASRSATFAPSAALFRANAGSTRSYSCTRSRRSSMVL